ncbi:hypothetical protein EJ02DRAFT_425980 [Clathrospora elynae]|uniref:SAP domain-containing protein n=1 Tax=Clathrospora elynae TaxID=706981 RepID=A0A6A5SDZ9_9PLEO|nr:hypothetical protein EJ02DRAFT_425980 [Clathrospora elynae]
MAEADVNPSKKQKTGENSSAPTAQAQQSESPKPRKNEPKLFDTSILLPHEYVCMLRPRFDYELENSILGDDGLEEDDIFREYIKESDKAEESGTILRPVKDHPDWKWVILWEGFETFLTYKRRANYCAPDNFQMYIYNDFNGYGLQELMENLMVAFDAALKKKDDVALKRMWAVISALALWLNEVDTGPYTGCEDGEKTKDLAELMGCALLTALVKLQEADELKPDSTFIDLPFVISAMLAWSDDLDKYGIDEDATAWRSHAAAYFKKAKLDASKGVASTTKLLEELDDGDAKSSSKDPWGWAKLLKKYKSNYGTKIGGTKYDITKMSRKERAKHAFDGEDPLKDVPDQALKDGTLDFT